MKPTDENWQESGRNNAGSNENNEKKSYNPNFDNDNKLIRSNNERHQRRRIGENSSDDYSDSRPYRPYRSNNNSDYNRNSNSDQSNYGNRGGYNGNRGGGYNSNRGGYDSNRSGGYNSNRGGYNSNRGGGYNANRGYNSRPDYDSSNANSDNTPREGFDNDNSRNVGYNNNRGYNSNRGGYNSNRGGYNSNRGGGYNSNRGGYDNNRDGGYNGNNGGGYNSNRGSYNNSNRGGGYNNNRNGGRFNSDFNHQPRPQRMPQPVEYDIVYNPDEEVRLNKFLANAGVCSRREADQLIQAGAISVNGVAVTELGTKIHRSDKVTLGDQTINPDKRVYLLLNKPKDCVTTTDDPNAKHTVMDIVSRACHERIYPVGRLDRNTTGVLLLTNDGDLAAKLTHPKFNKKKVYEVALDRPLEQADADKILAGITLDDGDIKPDALSPDPEDNKKIGLEIHSGRNRIVRRIFESVGYRVVRLDRTYFAGLTKKNLRRGEWRFLSNEEVNKLRMGSFE